MKLKELYENTEDKHWFKVPLIGQTVNNIVITSNTKSVHWVGHFNCSHRNLTTLEGSPKSVTKIFDCQYNRIKSLDGGPKIVDSNFDCSNNDQLESLHGAPKIVGNDFFCLSNKKITSLVGAPENVGNDFLISHCENITSLHNIHKQVKSIGQMFYANKCPIKSHVLGLLLIRELQQVDMDQTGEGGEVQDILNKYLKEPFGNKRVFDCQSEMLDAGLDEFAQL